MQAGGGCRHGTIVAGVNRLVPDSVLKFVSGSRSGNVGGEWDLSERLQNGGQIRNSFKLEQAIPFGVLLENGRLEFGWFLLVVQKPEGRPGTNPLSRSQHDPPPQGSDFFKEKDFHGTAGGDLEPVHSGRDHPGVVQYQ